MSRYLPDLSEMKADYLVGLFFDSGLMSSTAMGPSPLSWTDIHHWDTSLALGLSTWEKRVIKSMSNSYVAELTAARDQNRKAPWVNSTSEESKANLADRIYEFYATLAKRK